MTKSLPPFGNNPWHLLPEEAPFILPDEEEAVRKFNIKVGKESPRYLQINKILPEPFVGARDAQVVLLSNNPGFGKKKPIFKQEKSFMDKMRRNLRHDTLDFPFVFLDPEFSKAGTDRPVRPFAQWWARKLKEPLERFGPQVICKAVLNVTYFPYPSKRFGHRKIRVPSQEYSFRLVKEAMEREAVIVLMRKRVNTWLTAVPELDRYKRLFRVTNAQTPWISRGNCENYAEIVRAIEKTTK